MYFVYLVSMTANGPAFASTVLGASAMLGRMSCFQPEVAESVLGRIILRNHGGIRIIPETRQNSDTLSYNAVDFEGHPAPKVPESGM